MSEDLKFRVELNVLKHLGIGLYSSTPAVMTEVIANSWDADAERVDITIDPDADLIQVQDNGHGMSRQDVQDKFLKIGYSRRTREANKAMSRSGSRFVMGRKGIGKLAMFSLANRINVVTRAEGGDALGFAIDVKALWNQAEQDAETVEYPVEPIDVPADFILEHGTRITLTELNTRIHRTEDFLRPRLARRFGVFSDTFAVYMNGHPLQRSDAGFYRDIQFLWYFDESARDAVVSSASGLALYKDDDGVERPCIESIPHLIAGDPPELTVKGFIASVDTPAKLGKGEESVNKVSVFANGRLFQDDILAELGDARYFNSYLVGEVHADFLDRDDIDRATASREAIRHDDDKFQALRRHLRSVLGTIRDRWDEWRTLQGYENAPEKNAEVEAWIKGFADKRDRKAADRLMTSISKLVLNNDEERNREARGLLYRSAIVGFEKLRARQQLDALEKISDVLSPEFQAIFASLDDIEESYYLDIVKARLEVIRKFDEEIVDERKQEKVAQKYLFRHLWLLDPSWDRVTGSEEMEVTLSGELKRACPDSEEGARLDIAYCTTAGRHVIIELKRPGLYVPAAKLEQQGRKYVEAVEQWYREHPETYGYGGRLPPIDVYFLVERAPVLNNRESKSWDAYNLQLLTYKGLIANARQAYQAYMDVNREVGRVAAVLEKI